MAKQPKMLDKLFHDTLKDIYFAEKKILTALPKMAKAAQSDELRAAFEKHIAQTEGQVDRLEQVFAMIDAKPQVKTCAAIVGIVEEGQEIIGEYKGSLALDQVSLRPPRLLNIMRFRATARYEPGPGRWGFQRL